ncbi:MAG: multicopper oxidase domain-containing protein [Flavobacteriales bacterium]
MMEWKSLLGAVAASVFLSSPVAAQQVPPSLFSEMDGIHFLDDGTTLPIWGYGWVADGFITLPAPLLTYDEGAVVSLAFENPSPESHTIHLHGLDVDQANDGVPATSFFVTSGQSTTYDFTATHSGTYLYHCHVTTTLHLTMGMYGMVLVTRPDGKLFEGGPSVAQDIPWLFSDLEVATNLDPVGSFPFHDMRPDVFMVNGKSGSQLAGEVVYASAEEPTALRLASMAYSKIACHFPEGLNAELWMSDGREVPVESLDSLEIYPGERFTVLVQPEVGYDGGVTAVFEHMIDGYDEAQEFLQIREESLHPSHVTGLDVPAWYPNPASQNVHMAESTGRLVRVWTPAGTLVFEGQVPSSGLDVASWNEGLYLAQVEGRGVTRFVVAHGVR